MIDGHVATDTRGEDTERKDTDILFHSKQFQMWVYLSRRDPRDDDRWWWWVTGGGCDTSFTKSERHH